MLPTLALRNNQISPGNATARQAIVTAVKKKHESLTLESCKCTYLSAAWFKDLGCIEILDLSFNPKALAHFTIPITYLSNLTVLILSNNALTSFRLHNLPNLQKLALDHNQIAQLSLSKLPALRILNLSYNRLTRFQTPKDSPFLVSIDLLENLLVSFSMPIKLPFIRCIDLCGNKALKTVSTPHIWNLCAPTIFIAGTSLPPDFKEHFSAQIVSNLVTKILSYTPV
ncbi:MAG: Leucinerich repeat [Chlamydiota bacterium]|jgi:Leucine-rich repeat (LRR) protein